VSVKEDILAALRGREPEHVPWNIHHDLLAQGSLERELRNSGLGIIEKSVHPYQAVSSRDLVEERRVWETGGRLIT